MTKPGYTSVNLRKGGGGWRWGWGTTEKVSVPKGGNPSWISRNNRSADTPAFPFSTEDVVRAKNVNMGGSLQALITDRDPPLSEMI